MPMPAQAISPSTRRYLSEIRRHPVLTGDEERHMVDRLRERQAPVFEALVHANLSFVVKVAGEYRHLGVPFEDLLNEGNVGLVEAARRYDPTRGYRFISYAIWWIRKAMLRAVQDQSCIVRLSSHQLKKQRRLREAGAGPGSWLRLRQVSLDEPVGKEEGRTRLDLLADTTQSSAEDRLLQDEGTRLVRSAFSSLTPQERQVLAARFGLGVERALTLREIGADLGLSRERVRQIELKARRKVRKFFVSQCAGPFPRAYRRSILSGCSPPPSRRPVVDRTVPRNLSALSPAVAGARGRFL